MAEFKDILKQELSDRSGVGGAISGLASASGKKVKEKLDIRNILFGGKGITSMLGRTIFGKGYSALKDRSSKVDRINDSSSVVNEGSLNLLQVIATNANIQAKNSMSLPSIAKQMNITQKNIAKLVKLQGGTPSNKADSYFSNAKFRENAYEASYVKNKEGNKGSTLVQKTSKDEESNSIIGMLLAALGLGGLVKGVKSLTLGILKRIPIIGSIIMMIEDFFDSKALSESLGIGKVSGLIGQILGGSEGGIMNMFSNAGKWALLGAGIGSVVPVVGTLLGGVVGAILGGVMGYFGGDAIASNVDKAMTAVSRMVEDAWDGLKDFGTYLSDSIKNIIDSISASGKEALATVVSKFPGGGIAAKNLRESAAQDRGNIESRDTGRQQEIQQREATKVETRSQEDTLKTANKAQRDVAVGNVKGIGETGTTKEAMDFFVDKGWTQEQAAGIVGNLQAESGANLRTDAIGDGGKAYGIAQWHPDRQAKFQKTYGKPIQQAGFKEQLEFVNWELNNDEKKAGTALKGATSADEAAAIFDQYYERSSGAHRQQRMANALAWIKEPGKTAAEGTALAASPVSTPQVASVPTTPTKGAAVSSASAAVTDNKKSGDVVVVNNNTNNNGGGKSPVPTQTASSSVQPYDTEFYRNLMKPMTL